jgi:2-oxoglutarate dehydrogenase E2 component (dihydrolipoamide succinyltransferase)
MPKLGESIMEATILKWHKKAGDPVKQDETVLDIATDKVDSEVPSTAEGIIEEVLFKENDIVPIGAVIARIKVSSMQDTFSSGQRPAGSGENAVGNAQDYEEAKMAEEIPFQPTVNRQEAVATAHDTNKIRFYSPLVLNIAQQEGIGMAELEKIEGTGQEGRLSKKDILLYVANRNGGRKDEGGSAQGAPIATVSSGQVVTILPNRNTQNETGNEKTEQAAEPQPSSYNSPALSGANVEIIEMDRMRRLISKHMVDSKRISAHVTSFAECDVTNLVQWRNKIKSEFEKRENEKITFTPLFIEAIVKCIKKYPLLSSSVDGDTIIVKKDLNIGMATALPGGNLIVPVIKNADQLNLAGLTRQVNNLANNARNGKLKPDDTSGGTFTLTNVGTFGSIMGTPIINQPQVAIMAVGAIKKRPMVIETASGDCIAIRHMMYISLSYDHRIIDGALGSTFLNAVSKELENFDVHRSL